jgi:tetratricopeptide (TPR) repeat protein
MPKSTLDLKWANRELRVRTFDAFPQDWAKIQNNLGTTYTMRILGKQADNLEQAIAYYQESLRVYTSDSFRYEWARTLYNLGNAYNDKKFQKR